MKEYCRGLLFVKQKLQSQVDEINAAIKDLRETREKERISMGKDIQQLKLKNDQLAKELNIIRKKKHTVLEDHKISDTPQISSNLLIETSDINILTPVGQGSSSIVYKAMYRETLVAVKKLVILEEKPQQAMVSFI